MFPLPVEKESTLRERFSPRRDDFYFRKRISTSGSRSFRGRTHSGATVAGVPQRSLAADHSQHTARKHGVADAVQHRMRERPHQLHRPDDEHDGRRNRLTSQDQRHRQRECQGRRHHGKHSHNGQHQSFRSTFHHFRYEHIAQYDAHLVKTHRAVDSRVETAIIRYNNDNIIGSYSIFIVSSSSSSLKKL